MTRSQTLQTFLDSSQHPDARELRARLQTASNSERISVYKDALRLIEETLWQAEADDRQVECYQQVFRELEALLDKEQNNLRHHFILCIPVADRPQQLAACLQSILTLCRAFNYGGTRDGRFKKITLLIADDSRDENNIIQHQTIAEQFHAQGLETIYFGKQAQLDLLATLSTEEQASLTEVLGQIDAAKFYHKGSPRMRNIASLKLLELSRDHEKVLFYSFDSDQEFKIRINSAKGERDCYALNYFYYLDEIFQHSKICILTGKVVGDPPVSPAVMALNFLEDVYAFLGQIKSRPAQAPCGFHVAEKQHNDDAAYHDMPELFGFIRRTQSYDYPCPLHGEHDHGACLRRFAEKLNGFFYGEHPTRKSDYRYQHAPDSVAPARTVYPGNYIFNREGLNYFIPFAPLKLRMNGPSMGRIVKALLGDRFVAANLPMLHKRTFGESGCSEFRPDILQDATQVDLSGERERQYYGDVMLFSLEKLGTLGYPQKALSRDQVCATVAATEQRLSELYERRDQSLIEKKAALKNLLEDKHCWWNQSADYAPAVKQLAAFIDNIEHNFETDHSPRPVSTAAEKQARLQQISDSILNYPAAQQAWETLLASRDRERKTSQS